MTRTADLRSQGTRSNITGAEFEDKVAKLFHDRRLPARAREETGIANHFGKKIVLGVFVPPCAPFPKGLGIDTKAQYTPGSAADIITHKAFAICSTWIWPGVLIIEGENRDITPARDWARSIVGTDWLNPEQHKPRNLLGVFELDEFERWLDCCISEGAPVAPPQRTRMIDLITPSLFDL